MCRRSSLASPQVSKENYAPMRSGRSAAKLAENAAFAAKPAAALELKLANERQLRRLVMREFTRLFHTHSSQLSCSALTIPGNSKPSWPTIAAKTRSKCGVAMSSGVCARIFIASQRLVFVPLACDNSQVGISFFFLPPGQVPRIIPVGRSARSTTAAPRAVHTRAPARRAVPQLAALSEAVGAVCTCPAGVCVFLLSLTIPYNPCNCQLLSLFPRTG